MDFTKEEINLCKQVVEKHRKAIRFGDWYLDLRDDSIGLHQHGKSLRRERISPLWTISDCISWLCEKGINHIFNFMCFKNGNWRFTAEDNKYKKLWGEGETRLAACLKAVLAILEGK